MARNQVSRRPRRRERTAASSQAKQSENVAQNPSSEDEVGMLPRMLVRFGVAAVIVAFVVLMTMASTHLQTTSPSTTPNRELSPPEQAPVEERVERRAAARPTVEVLAKYPHDAAAFTQGFTVANSGHDKVFIESTGLFGQSSLRHVDISSGKVLKQYDLPKELFGEGVTLGPDDELVMLTWKSKTGLVFDFDGFSHAKVDSDDGFALKREFTFDSVTGEGWGITYDGKEFIVSDGSSTLLFWDPSTMEEVRRVDVTIYDGTQQISQINELEAANGFIYANVWYQPYILKIDPTTGAVVTMFDLSKLVADAGADVTSGAVLNGIAYDAAEDVFYVTGKLWSSAYKVRLVDPVQ